MERFNVSLPNQAPGVSRGQGTAETKPSVRAEDEIVDNVMTVVRRPKRAVRQASQPSWPATGTVMAASGSPGSCGRPGCGAGRRNGGSGPRSRTRPLPARVDKIRRDFTADASQVNSRWCGDMTYIPTWEGRLYLAKPLTLSAS
jgi:hypothetical protein